MKNVSLRYALLPLSTLGFGLVLPSGGFEAFSPSQAFLPLVKGPEAFGLQFEEWTSTLPRFALFSALTLFLFLP
jgi:hypothetical protein